ncbi:hypothetical protein [Actibacterium sp. XHP0104]|uniref:hypothetical protein n=1 Tax=Actibacterium sp. XHP0104 TaxID=2984335 RepID=UPI0021E84D17|nr:hypothetical protein [Actibacterium sp. XHP0104]MCV2883038.1 hypothetical protein [Actibacterium sp. XHP0104]
MAEDKKQQTPIELGVYGRRIKSAGITPADMIALALSVFWLLITVVFFSFAGSDENGLRVDPGTFVMTLLAIVMPIALIWVGASAAKSSKIIREESARLQAAIDAMRHTYIQQQQSATMGVRPTVEKKLDEIAAATRQAETVIATFASSRARQDRPAPPKPATGADADQPSLALGTTAEDMAPPLPVDDFIRALNFPETAEDKDGFRALRRALQDRSAARLVRSAQDVLTLLSQDGIYMDDLRPDRARPEVWRKFAQGERGPAIAALGGVRDRSSLALTSGRMRQDPVFRDAAHHFLRQFDHTLTEFEPNASDQELSDLAETRTARAFMLLGRVSGTFD